MNAFIHLFVFVISICQSVCVWVCACMCVYDPVFPCQSLTHPNHCKASSSRSQNYSRKVRVAVYVCQNVIQWIKPALAIIIRVITVSRLAYRRLVFCFCCKMGVKGDEMTDLITRKRLKLCDLCRRRQTPMHKSAWLNKCVFVIVFPSLSPSSAVKTHLPLRYIAFSPPLALISPQSLILLSLCLLLCFQSKMP